MRNWGWGGESCTANKFVWRDDVIPLRMSWARTPTEIRIDPSLFYNNFVSLAYKLAQESTLYFCNFFLRLAATLFRVRFSASA